LEAPAAHSLFVAVTAGFCWSTMVKYTTIKKLENDLKSVTSLLQ
jgi:hypothetical protein